MFLFSLLMILLCLGGMAWLIATGQAATVDGLFMLLTCALVALVFALYVVFLLRRTLAAPDPEAAKKPAAQRAEAKQPAPAAAD